MRPFAQYPALEAAWRSEYEGCEGTQNFPTPLQNYPVLKGTTQTNLYKCFLPQVRRLGAERGSPAFYIPKGFMMILRAGYCVLRFIPVCGPTISFRINICSFQ